MLVHAALIADLTLDNVQRNNMSALATFLMTIGSLPAYLAYVFWDPNNLFNFRIFCIILAILSCFGYIYTANHLRFSFRSLSDFLERHVPLLKLFQTINLIGVLSNKFVVKRTFGCMSS